MDERTDSPVSVADEVLVEAWHGDLSVFQLADMYGVSYTHINQRWQKLRRENKLPHGHRKRANKSENLKVDPGTDIFDGRPTCGFQDPLLSKLIEVHGHRGRPDFFHHANVKWKKRVERKSEV